MQRLPVTTSLLVALAISLPAGAAAPEFFQQFCFGCHGETKAKGHFNFERLAEEEMISPGDLDLFSYAEDAEGAWNALVRVGLKPGPRAPGFPSLS